MNPNRAEPLVMLNSGAWPLTARHPPAIRAERQGYNEPGSESDRGDGGITAPSLVTGLTHHHPRSPPAADHPQKLQVLEECLYVQQAHEKIPNVANY